MVHSDKNGHFLDDSASTNRNCSLDTANLAETSTSKKYVKIFNLSNRKLSKHEMSVLLKGLKFTPTPEKSNHEQLSNDIAEFHRKLKLKEYFTVMKIQCNMTAW